MTTLVCICNRKLEFEEFNSKKQNVTIDYINAIISINDIVNVVRLADEKLADRGLVRKRSP